MPEAYAGREARYTDLGSLRPEQRRAKRTQLRGFKRPSLSTHTSGHHSIRQDHHHSGSDDAESSLLRQGYNQVASSQPGPSHHHHEQRAGEFRQIASQRGAIHAHSPNTTEQSIPRRPPLNAASIASTSRSYGSSMATGRNGDFQTMSFLEFSSQGRGSILTQDSRQWPTPSTSQDLRRASISASYDTSNNSTRPLNSICIDLTQDDGSSSSSESDLPDYDDSSSTNDHRHLASARGLSKSHPLATVPPQNIERPPQSQLDAPEEQTQDGTGPFRQTPNAGLRILPSATPEQVQGERHGNTPICTSQPSSSTPPKLPSPCLPRERPRFITPPARDSTSPESAPDAPQVTSTVERSSNGSTVLEPTSRLPLSRAERLRQKRLESFDSDAFDAAIYQQEGTNPPAGLQIPITALRKTIPLPAFAQRQAASPNRYIHGMHPPLPVADQAARDAEIAARGGRKMWFRRVAARQAMRIRKDRSVPAWQRPRIAYRVRDISFLAEHELPNEVRGNEGWMDFWRWFRQGKLEAYSALRRRRKAGLSSGCNLGRST